MRRVVVFGALMSMLAAVVGMGVTRDRPATRDASEASGTTGEDRAEPSDDASASAHDPAATPEASANPSADPKHDDDATHDDTPAPPEPLSVVALDWEILAPGVLANDGMTPSAAGAFGKVGLDVRFESVATAAQLEAHLGRGGEAKDGADIALMPLPVFVASYERLRALSPQVFFVVAWSRGGDVLIGDEQLLRQPPRGTLRLTGDPGTSETLLGLFALQQAGVSPSRVQLVEPAPGHPRTRLRTIRRRRSRQLDARSLVMSTAEATHLVPVVAVAPAGVVQRRKDALVRWSRVWMQGAQSLEADPAAAARHLAAQPGAPEAVDLIDALGWLTFTDLHQAAQAAGLSGRGAVDLDSLFHRTWQLWRGSGLLTTPPPQRVPLTAVVIADLAREATPPAPITKPRRSTSPEPTDVLLRHTVAGRRLGAEAESALVAEVGFLAGVFSRSTLEVWVPRSPEAGRRVARHVAERFGLPQERITVRSRREPRSRTAAVVEIHAAR